MRFWEVLLTEPPTKTLQALAADDLAMLVWWATEVECASAIARLERDVALDESAEQGSAPSSTGR
jgi:hypothetical protein